MTAVISSFWLRVRNRCIYDRGKKLVVYASVTTRGIYNIYCLGGLMHTRNSKNKKKNLYTFCLESILTAIESELYCLGSGLTEAYGHLKKIKNSNDLLPQFWLQPRHKAFFFLNSGPISFKSSTFNLQILN